MSGGFTPGPWAMAKPPYDSIPWQHVYGPDGKHIMHQDRGADEKIASARLIAAAPELYEALSDLLDQPGVEALPDALLDKYSAALAKARGE